MAKIKKKTSRGNKVITKLLPLSSVFRTATVSEYIGIINTDWRYASRCSFSSDMPNDWNEALQGATVYFPAVFPYFSFDSSSSFASEVKWIGRVDGKHLALTATYYMDEDTKYTLSLFFKDSICNMSKLVDCIQDKSSSVIDIYLHVATEHRKNPAKRDFYYEQSINAGMSPRLAAFTSGSIPVDRQRAVLKQLLAGDAIMDLYNIFQVLSFADYFCQLHDVRLDANSTSFGIPDNNVKEVLARCTSKPLPFGNFKIEYSEVEQLELSGSVSSFYTVHGKARGYVSVHNLSIATGLTTFDLNAITAKSAESYFYLDKYGNPIKGVTAEDFVKADYIIADTGLKAKVNNADLFGIFNRESETGERPFRLFGFMCLVDLLHLLIQRGVTVDNKFWGKYCSVDFHINGKGFHYEEQVPEDVAEIVTFYKCSNEFLERVKDTTNIKTLSQANFFIDGFIRMCRRRRLENNSVASIYNTGLMDSKGNFVWLQISNLYDEYYQIQPALLSGIQLTDDPILPYADAKYLRLRNYNDIELDMKGLEHILSERSFRCPKRIEGMPAEVLLPAIQMSLAYAKQVLKVDPYFAQPAYSVTTDKIHHILPLYLGTPYVKENLGGALYIMYGRVATLYSLEMAREYATEFSISMPRWLAELDDDEL